MQIHNSKFIFETRHLPNLLYEETRLRLFNKFMEKFSVLKLNNQIIELTNEKNSKNIFAEISRFGYSAENISDLDQIMQEAINFVVYIKEGFKINKFSRIGNRYVFILDYGLDFNPIFDKMMGLFYKTDSINKIGNVVDFGTYTLSIEDEIATINFTMGPFKKSQAQLLSEFKNSILPENFALLDIDIIHKDLTEKMDFVKFINYAKKRALTLVDNFNNLMK